MVASTRSGATAKKTAAILLSVLLAGSGIYVLWLYSTGQPPFCTGYPPGGDCPGNYTYSFSISVNYSNSWSLTYYGFHSVGAPHNPFSGAGNYTGGSYTGTGSSQQVVKLSGPNTNGLTICVQAEKLDPSSSTMTQGIESFINSTSVPFGHVSLCMGVVP